MKDAAAQVYEQLLILRCQTGDESALGELIARYSPGVRLFLVKMTGQAATTDDLLQDTWFDVYRKINGLQRPEAFAAWLYRIARDKAYRELRRRPAAGSLVDENLAESVAAQEESFTHEEALAVRAALDELPIEQREVLVLRFIEEMSYEQIADVIARPLGTVRSRIHYAKLALRETGINNHPKGTAVMNEKELGRVLLRGEEPIDLQALTDRVLRRDRRRMWLLGIASIVAWMLVVMLPWATILPMMAKIVQHHQAEIARNVVSPAGEQREQSMLVLQIVKEGTIATFILSLGSMFVAALCTVSLIILSRRATLRQVNARLAEISGHLRTLAGASK